MNIERVTLEPVRYRLRKPLRTHRTELRERRGFRVCLHGSGGLVGLGEALPLVTSGTESPQETEAALGELTVALGGRSGTLDELLDRIDDTCPGAPAARCAFDGALHDLRARIRGVPVAHLLGGNLPRAVPVNAVIGACGPDASVAAAREAKARGFGTLKLKVGEASSDEDEARLRAVRRAVGAELRLRIDANGAWSARNAIAILSRLEPLAIEFVEQPVPGRDLAGLARVHSESPITVAADEALAWPEGRQALLEGKLAEIAVLKPMLLGGLRTCMRLATAAGASGVRCVVTTTFEGWIGTALATHLAAAMQPGDLACGLASSDVLESTFPPELIPHEGRISVHDRPGLGCTEPG